MVIVDINKNKTNKEIIIRSKDYKDGYSDAIISVVGILTENFNITQHNLISLLNTVVLNINRD